EDTIHDSRRRPPGRGHGGLCRPTVSCGVVDFERAERHTSEHIASHHIELPANDPGCRVESGGGHWRLRGPRIGEWVIYFERAHYCSGTDASHSVEQGIADHSCREPIPGRRHWRFNGPD